MTIRYGKGSSARPFSSYTGFLQNFDEIPNMGKNTLAAKLAEKIRQEQEQEQPEQKVENP